MQTHLTAQIIGEGHYIARTVVVDAICNSIIHRHVINGSQMENMIDLARDLFEVGRANQPRVRYIAEQRQQTISGCSVALRLQLKFFPRSLTHKNIDLGVFSLEQFFQQEFADEACRAGDEVVHLTTLLMHALTGTI